jgi:hypothetical protein
MGGPASSDPETLLPVIVKPKLEEGRGKQRKSTIIIIVFACGLE